jgi:hypothetical protein
LSVDDTFLDFGTEKLGTEEDKKAEKCTPFSVVIGYIVTKKIFFIKKLNMTNDQIYIKKLLMITIKI